MPCPPGSVSAAALAVLFLGVASASAQQQNPSLNIVQIYDLFLMGANATRQCDQTASAETWARWNGNFDLVTVRAFERLQQMHPTRTKAEIGKAMDERQAEIAEHITQSVQKDGCQAERMVKLVRTFRVHAGLDFTAKPKP